MEDRKKKLVKSIVYFLLQEIEGTNLDADRKESLEVAVQCLETAYDLEGQRETPPAVVDLLRVMEGLLGTKSVPEADKVEAESCKNRGNEFMKSENYAFARKEYTKAIKLDPYNAVYYCNRAAAFNRLGQYEEVIADCEAAIRLDPTYGKAYGRLGIAYSNLNRYVEAKNAYAKAAQLDPTNPTYKANMKLAEEKITDSSEMPDFTQYMNNPNLVNIASQMLNDPQFRNMMSGIIAGADTTDSNINTLLQAGAHLAAQMENTNPAFVETLRRTIDATAQQEHQGGEENQTQGTGSEKKSE